MNGRLQQRGEQLQCPICHALYRADYPTKESAPKGTIGREQHESGICSRACLLKADTRGVTHE